MKIKMITEYRDLYKPGDVVDENPTKASQLVERGSAEYVDVVKEAPANKEVTDRKGVICDICGKGFTARGIKSHITRMHG